VRIVSPGVETPPTFTDDRRDPSVILSIGRLAERYKGHDVLLRALPLVRARVPGARLVVIGDGPLRAFLEQLAATEGVADSVNFLGSVADGERDRWLRRARVLAMPSRLRAGRGGGEGFGIVFLEAGAHGVPVVGGDVGGAQDAIVAGETGLLADPNDPVAVADAIAGLLTDDEQWARLGRNGRARASGQSWEAVAASIAAILREAAG
jgi:phosphatidylinositol alpha-1,6-mannosyltransferase